MVGWLAWGKATISVQQGAMRTGSILRLSVAESLPSPSSARVRAGGTASSTASKPEYTCCESSAPAGAQLPALRIERIGLDLRHLRAGNEAVAQRLGPVGGQRVHARLRHPVGLERGRAASATRPWASSTRTRLALQRLHQAGRAFERQRKARVAHGEVLRAAVEAAEGGVDARHAPAGCGLAFEQRDLVAGLHQRSCTSHPGDAGADDGEIARRARGGWGSVTVGGLGRLLCSCASAHDELFSSGWNAVGCVCTLTSVREPLRLRTHP